MDNKGKYIFNYFYKLKIKWNKVIVVSFSMV